jgi:hypothetical protein
MPYVYVSGKTEFEVEVGKENEFIYKQWTSKKLSSQRKEYKKPCISFWYELENLIEPISPFVVVVTELDLYEGIFTTMQNGRKFKFEFDGKAKTSVHKLTKIEIDKGRKPKLTGVNINGDGISIEGLSDSLIIQSKKPV